MKHQKKKILRNDHDDGQVVCSADFVHVFVATKKKIFLSII